MVKKSIQTSISGALSVASKVVAGRAASLKELRASVMTLRNAYQAQKNVVKTLRGELERANNLIEMLSRK